MTLIELLRPEQRQWLRRLRKRVGNRENMRRYRAEYRDKKLCAGVDLPIEAGTCGRLVWPGHERCHACHLRRKWLLNHALNPAELTIAALLKSIENAAEAGAGSSDENAAEPEPAASLPEDSGRAVPLLDDLQAVPLLDDLELGDPCLRW